MVSVKNSLTQEFGIWFPLEYNFPFGNGGLDTSLYLPVEDSNG